MPYHLTTVEFNRIVASRLKPDGIYLANVIDKLEDGEFLKAYANALRAVFPHVYIFGRGDALHAVRSQHLRADGEPAAARPRDARGRDVGGAGLSDGPPAMPDARLDSYLKSGRALTLTDDFAPVDQLLASLFIERE